MKIETDYHIVFEDFDTQTGMDLELLSDDKAFLRDEHCFKDQLLYQGRMDEITEKEASVFLKQITLKPRGSLDDNTLVYPDYKDEGTYYSDWRKSLKSLSDKEYCIVYLKLS